MRPSLAGLSLGLVLALGLAAPAWGQATSTTTQTTKTKSQIPQGQGRQGRPQHRTADELQELPGDRPGARRGHHQGPPVQDRGGPQGRRRHLDPRLRRARPARHRLGLGLDGEEGDRQGDDEEGRVQGQDRRQGSVPPGGKVDLNTATAEELEELPGIGPREVRRDHQGPAVQDRRRPEGRRRDLRPASMTTSRQGRRRLGRVDREDDGQGDDEEGRDQGKDGRQGSDDGGRQGRPEHGYRGGARGAPWHRPGTVRGDHQGAAVQDGGRPQERRGGPRPGLQRDRAPAHGQPARVGRDEDGREEGRGQGRVAPAKAAAKEAEEEEHPAQQSRKKAALAPGRKININTASVEELQELPGIGPVRSEAIVKGRPFETIEDVMKVDGIKEGIFGWIKDHISVK